MVSGGVRWLAAALAVAAALLAACGDGSPSDAPDQVAPTPGAFQTNPSSREQLGTDLIAHPSWPFAVTFKWENPARDEEAWLVWRQGNGVRRWDLVDIVDGEVTGGSITVTTDFSGDDTLGYSSLDCLWVTGPSAPITRNAPPDQAFVDCGSGESLIFKPLGDVLLAHLGSQLDDTTIAGRSARCYMLDDWRFTAAVLCADATERVPLLIMTEYHQQYGDYRFSQSMEAVSVSTATQDVPVPLGLEPDAAKRFPEYQGMVPISDLGLPDLPELAEFQQ